MLDVVEAQKLGHESIIEINPRDVLLHRVESRKDGSGGREEFKGYVGIVRARLYQSSYTRRTGSEVDGPVGLKLDDDSWGLSMYAEMQDVDEETGEGIVDIEDAPVMIDTDVRAGANVSDTFECEYGKFKIVSVKPRDVGGLIWGWDAVCELET